MTKRQDPIATPEELLEVLTEEVRDLVAHKRVQPEYSESLSRQLTITTSALYRMLLESGRADRAEVSFNFVVADAMTGSPTAYLAPTGQNEGQDTGEDTTEQDTDW